MKISKLFHWLYAILMLLPVFAIGVTCAYVIFNKNAYQSYYGETINEEQYTYTDEIEIGENYRLTLPSNNLTIHNTNGGNRNNYIEVSNFKVIENSSPNDITNTKYISFWSASNSINYSIYFYEDISAGSTELLSTSNTTTYSISVSFTIISKTSVIDVFFEGNNNIFYQVEYNSSSFLSEVFYYSIDKVEQSPLFSWAYDSFLATPITYISDLFGIASNHPVILLMSYWLSISIIWLVFDLVMYMPLLVHRWLDKGVLE